MAASKAFAMDPRRIFLEKLRLNTQDDEYMNSGLDDNAVSCLVDVVNVLHRKASDEVVPPEYDFYYDMSYDEEFCTFEDVNEFTPPPMVHPPIGSHLDGRWKPDAKQDMAVDGHLQLLIVFCLMRSQPGNINQFPAWPGLEHGLFADTAMPADAAAASTDDVGGRQKRPQPTSKKETSLHNLGRVLTGYVRAALAHSPHAARINAAVTRLGWDTRKGRFETHNPSRTSRGV
jgi:hypothetical protein